MMQVGGQESLQPQVPTTLQAGTLSESEGLCFSGYGDEVVLVARE